MFLKHILPLTLAVVLGLLIGYLDWHASEVQPIVLLVLIAVGAVSFFWPRWSWLAAIVVAVCIPIAHLIGRAMGYTESYPIEPNVWAALLALIPAFIAAGLGAGARWAIGKLRR